MQADRRLRPTSRNLHLFEVVVITAFIGIIAFCAYDGFKEIFTKPPPFEPKGAQESLAELKAAIAQSKITAKNHKYVKAGRGERRSALATDPPELEDMHQLEQQQLVFEPFNEALEEDPQPTTKVVVLSSVQEAPCITDGGDNLHFLSTQNKQDYARVHGYEFVLGMKQADPELENMWNKPAWISKVLEDTELGAEWLLWVDIDTVILDVNFTLPFEEFAAKSKDLVVYGNVTQVRRGHPVEALNTGVMVIRNTPWARHFFSEVCRLGRLDDHHIGKQTLSKILLKELQADAYSDGLRDQNAVIYLLKTHPEWQDRVKFLDKEICLNCYWRDLVGVTGFGTPEYNRKEDISFIQHFMGCQICNALNRNGDLDSCQSAMLHSFNYTRQKQDRLLRASSGRPESYLSQLRDLPYCSNHPGIAECTGAKPLDERMSEQLRNQKDSMKYDWKSIDNHIVESTLNHLKNQELAGQNEAASSTDYQQYEGQNTGIAGLDKEHMPGQETSDTDSDMGVVDGGNEPVRLASMQTGRQKQRPVERREARSVEGIRKGKVGRRSKHAHRHSELDDSEPFVN